MLSPHSNTRTFAIGLVLCTTVACDQPEDPDLPQDADAESRSSVGAVATQPRLQVVDEARQEAGQEERLVLEVDLPVFPGRAEAITLHVGGRTFQRTTSMPGRPLRFAARDEPQLRAALHEPAWLQWGTGAGTTRVELDNGLRGGSK